MSSGKRRYHDGPARVREPYPVDSGHAVSFAGGMGGVHFGYGPRVPPPDPYATKGNSWLAFRELLFQVAAFVLGAPRSRSEAVRLIGLVENAIDAAYILRERESR